MLAGRRRSARRLRDLILRLESSQAAAGPLASPSPDPDHDRLLAAFGQLRYPDREALALVLWEQLSHAEAAQVLGFSANAVAIRVHRAKARLRQELTRERPDACVAGQRLDEAERFPAATDSN